MNKDLVSVAHGRGPYQNVIAALKRLALSVIRGRRVLIKPNAGRHVTGCCGITTHPEAVAAVIDAVKAEGPARLAIGESPILGVDTMEAFDSTGIAAVAREKGIPLIDMDRRKPVKKPVKNGRVLDSLRFCADIFDFDFIISVPVAKTHMHTQVTLGIKNMKGCLWHNEKVRLHQLEYRENRSFPEKTLDSAISDMATMLLPDLTVIDGFTGMEGLGPSSGEAIRSDIAVASFNPLAADKAALELMGFALDEVIHLKLIRDRGNLSLAGVSVEPEDYLKLARVYKRSPDKLDVEFPNIVLHDENSCSACLSTTLLFLKRFADELGDYVLPDGKLHLAIGKDIHDFPEGTILIGNCTHKHKDRGVFVSGCPPVASRIYKAITGVEPGTNEPEVK
jgi:uncharacterized protein (DUF362 family)